MVLFEENLKIYMATIDISIKFFFHMTTLFETHTVFKRASKLIVLLQVL